MNAHIGAHAMNSETAFLDAVGEIAYINPFTPRRLELERQLLGGTFVESAPSVRRRGVAGMDPVNVDRLTEQCAALTERLHQRYAGKTPTQARWDRYEDLVLFTLFYLFWEKIDTTVQTMCAGDAQPTERSRRVPYYRTFKASFDRWMHPSDKCPPPNVTAAHAFACFLQLRRAFFHIYEHLVGSSRPMVELRASIWQSIFTHDMRRYRRTLYDKLGNIPTLITGPSGTGKELVARAVGMSRYIPFDEKTQTFADDLHGAVLSLNISALSGTLVESELFGHQRGSFTGAIADRAGWLEVCRPLGAVFLDEIGDLDPSIQVKLLRVLQTRTFQRIGDTKDRLFAGKIMAATHVDLSQAMAKGRLREDFYYRLAADRIHTPGLAEQLKDQPGDMRLMIYHLLRRIVADEAESLVDQTLEVIARDVPADYAWPGNVRELEQCTRNVLIRHSYRPPPEVADATPAAVLATGMADGKFTADQLLDRYCRLVYEQTGSYVETARRLGLDRRTVRARVERCGQK